MASGGKWFSSEADGEDSGRERPADSKSRGAAKNPKSTNFIEEMLLESEELLRGGAAAAEPYVAPPSSQSDGSDAQPQQQPQPQQHRTIAVDRSGLLGAKAAAAPQEPKNPAKTRLTELGAYLKEIILMRGPISVAEFMKQALSNVKFGYYNRKDTIGRAGDFVTAPEITSLFGELIGIWCTASWQACGSPKQVNLVEIGPGKGTLMQDVLRTIKKFPKFYKAVEVHLVDVSSELRFAQQKAIGAVNVDGSPPVEFGDNSPLLDPNGCLEMKLEDGKKAVWHSTFDTVPEGPILVIAQELFDALPVHVFQCTDSGTWREQLVDVDTGLGPHHFRFVLAPSPTPALYSLLGHGLEPFLQKGTEGGPNEAAETGDAKERAATVHAAAVKGVRPAVINALGQGGAESMAVIEQQLKALHSVVSNGTSERSLYAASAEPYQEQTEDANEGSGGAFSSLLRSNMSLALANASPGDTIEFSPVANALAYSIASRITEHKGAALMIDYGEDHAFSNSLRGIQHHTYVDILQEPGAVDISAYVDFNALKTAGKMAKAKTFGPVTQSEFLQRMGIEHRINQVLEACESDEEAEALAASVNRLVSPDEMGEIYKVLGFSSHEVPGFGDKME